MNSSLIYAVHMYMPERQIEFLCIATSTLQQQQQRSSSAVAAVVAAVYSNSASISMAIVHPNLWQ